MGYLIPNSISETEKFNQDVVILVKVEDSHKLLLLYYWVLIT